MPLPPFETLRNAVIAGAMLLALMLTLLGPAPAGAVVGGEEIDGTTTQWFASLGCGGTLVAPDRIVTAAHCVENRRLASLEAIWVGGAIHKATALLDGARAGAPATAATTSRTSRSSNSTPRSRA